MMRWLFRAALWPALLLAGTPARAADLQVVWRAPAKPGVEWRGIIEAEGSGVGPGGAMVYPAPGLAGFLVAVLTHGAVLAGAQSSERQRQQDAADRVLDPYLPALREWTADALWDSATVKVGAPDANRVASSAGTLGAAWVGEAMPSFAMTQDSGTLVLDLAIKLTPGAGGAATEAFARVVSAPLQVPDAAAHWGAEGARALKAAAASMLAHALTLSIRHAQADPTDAEVQPSRTYRYMMGSTERTERGQLLASGCGRNVLRTLRGWLLSVPVRADSVARCPDPYKV